MMAMLVAFLGAISPGPDILLIIRVSLRENIKTIMLTIAGVVSGCAFHLSILYFGFVNIINNSYTQAGVCILGGLYLLYLALNLLRSSESNVSVDLNKTIKGGFKTGLIVNLSNPKAILFFGTIASIYIDKNLFLSILMILSGTISGFMLAVFITTFFKRFINNKTFHIIDKVCGVLFIVFSIMLFINAVKQIQGML